MEKHWFDPLNKALVRENPRRSLLGATALLASLGLDTPFSAAAKKRRKRKKGNNGKKKDHKKYNAPKLCGPQIHTLCDSEFREPDHTPQDRQYCKDQCERCKKTGTPFCIHLPDMLSRRPGVLRRPGRRSDRSML
jgi:hypothetical protein